MVHQDEFLIHGKRITMILSKYRSLFTILIMIAFLSGLEAGGCRRALSAENEPADRKIDLTNINNLITFDNDDYRKSVFRQMCAMSSWRVLKLSNSICATRCFKSDLPGDSTLNQIAINIYFEGSPRLDTDRTSHFIIKKSELGNLDVKLDDIKKHMGRLWVTGGDVGIEIAGIHTVELASIAERAVKALSAEFSVIRRNVKLISENGFVSDDVFDPQSLPVVVVGALQPSLAIENSGQKGIYHVHGLLNPKEQGWIEIRVTDKDTGALISKIKQERRTPQYVGWGGTEKYLFPFSSEITVDGSGDSKHVNIEVWFHPDSERRLLSKEQEVTTWAR
jgi:hypothetical protein